jgi:hypothetical protein
MCQRHADEKKKGPGAKQSNHVTNTCISWINQIKGS